MIKFLKLLNAPCDDMAALASRALDERLTWAERFALRTHVLYCKACRRYRRQLQLIRNVLSSSVDEEQGNRSELAPVGESPTLSPEARSRIQNAISEHGAAN